MRIRELQTLLAVTFDDLGVTAGTSSDGTTVFQNLERYRRAVDEVARVPSLAPQVKAVRQLAPFTDARDQVTIAPGQGPPMISAMQRLREKSAELKDLLDPIVEPEKDTTLSVRLPDDRKLEEIPALVQEVDQFLTSFVGLPVGDEDERVGVFTFTGTDAGSAWLNVEAASVAVVNLVAFAVYSALSMINLYKRQQVELEMMKAVASDTKDIAAHNKLLRRAQRRALAENMKKHVASKATTEDVSRMAVIIHQGEKMLTQRFQIECSQLAPPKARDAIAPASLPKVDPLGILPEGTGRGTRSGRAARAGSATGPAWRVP
jgi:hypothetical protein